MNLDRSAELMVFRQEVHRALRDNTPGLRLIDRVVRVGTPVAKGDALTRGLTADCTVRGDTMGARQHPRVLVSF